ncbi:hypothetical protein PTW35_25430 (plasmid) [Photobacterium sp. DA100]|uniref:hypothetical protein n=1 Tax=Photobacterium sp. DA100 TaxID=3027472 RepID=UPI002479C26D|nr:hypothetical protein [Photobacterium sp. DA100]WEM44605.1 hypothetical protein PTW35_25430 [Photobacterium sp. DA100]
MNKQQLCWFEDKAQIESTTLDALTTAVTKHNQTFKQQHPNEYSYGLTIQELIGGIINTAIVTENSANKLNNCSLNAIGLATRQPTHLVQAEAMTLLRNRDTFFWSKYVQPVVDQVAYISLYLTLKAEQDNLCLSNPKGSQWYELDQTNITLCQAYQQMSEYEDGTRFIVGVGLMEDLIRDNSHYLYSEKVNGKLIFIDGQTNLFTSIDATFYSDYFDFSHIQIPKVTGMIYWAINK